MEGQIKVTGMVIKSMPVGDYDNRVVLLTKQVGKITIFVKGARRQNSRFLACSRPFAFGEYEVYKGKDAYSLCNSNVKEYFYDITKDYDKTTLCFYFLELSDYFGKEGLDASETINLLYATFKAIIKDKIPKEIVKSVFELKILVLNGIYPNIFSCSICNSKKDLFYYSSDTKSIYCNKCYCDSKLKCVKNSVKMDNDLIYTLQFVISAPINKLYTFILNEYIKKKFNLFVEEFFKQNISRNFKSLEIYTNCNY